MNLTDALQISDGPALNAVDSAQLECLARHRISEWWVRADIVPNYPTDDETAVKLVQSVDYSISLEALVRFCDVRAFTGVSINEGRRQWSARDIARLALFLECRRQWQPGSELHAAKRTACELALENLRATGQAHEMFHDLETFDLRALLLMLVESDSRMQRELLKCAIEIKLESFDIIV
jgi:hypothetical protein